MKNLVLAFRVFWAKVLALWPKGKTRKYIDELQAEINRQREQALLANENTIHWRTRYETFYAENRELKKQLAEKISELQKTDSWNVELNKDKTRLIDESNTLNDQCLRLAAQVQRLTASVQELERERERWVNKTQAHRDARRIICAELNKLGQIDSYAEKQPPPTAPPPERISYRTPTRKDLKNGPIPVEVSNDGENWSVYWLFDIGNHPNPYYCRFLNDKNAESRFFYLARVWE
jgi:septal ring factor EnvC (AmiA/AmiB activator)